MFGLYRKSSVKDDWTQKLFCLFPFFSGNNHTTKPYIKKFTKQGILAVECLKPKFQSPCQIFQKFKCSVKKNGLWKISACRQREMKSLDRCDCHEKRLQRKFLNRHTNSKFKASHFIHKRQKRSEELSTVLKGNYLQVK